MTTITVKELYSPTDFISVEVNHECNHEGYESVWIERDVDESEGAVNFIGEVELIECTRCHAVYDPSLEAWDLAGSTA